MNDEGDVATVIETVDLISKKWHPAIIQTLLESGPLRFNELQRELGDVSGKVLTDSLSDLVETELVERTVVSESPKRVEYELTAHGRDLQTVIDALATWGDQHLDEDARPSVLVVDDDPRLAEMHAGWLADRYDVETAHSGEEALDLIDDDLDLLVLDRRMPGLDGEEVLERLAVMDVHPAVVMLTAVEPDFDVVEMGCDDYIVKPGQKQTVIETVEDVLDWTALDPRVREYLSLSALRSLLAAETTERERERDERFARLTERMAELEREMEDGSRDVDPKELQDLFADER